jgi:hypothetical protein
MDENVCKANGLCSLIGASDPKPPVTKPPVTKPPVPKPPVPAPATPICRAGGLNDAFKSYPAVVNLCSKIIDENVCKATEYCSLISA